MNQLIIETHDLDFYFKDFKVLKNINLEVPKGSIFGFLGPNGAGKTTTIRVLLDLFHAPHDKVKLFGKNYQSSRTEILQNTGALIENPSIYKHLTGRQNLEIIRRMVNAPKSRIDEVLQVVRLVKNADKKVKSYSLGMCQRLGLASALLTDPELLILDEPTNGLDPSGIIEMRELIIRLNQEHGKTIFLSSHILSEIEKLATDVAIIDQGKIEFQGKMDQLFNKNGLSLLDIEVGDVERGIAAISELNFTVNEIGHGLIQVPINSKEDIHEINKKLVTSGIPVFALEPSNSLENVFLNITQKLDQ